MFKRIFTVILMLMTMAMPLNMSVQVSAEENSDISLYSVPFTSTLTVSGTTATCKSSGEDSNGNATKIIVSQSLQKKNSSGSWTIVQAWSNTINNYYGTVTNSKSGLASGTYRLKSTFYLYVGNTCTSTNTVYSSSKTI